MSVRGRPVAHGGCVGGKNSRLYTCWLSMKKRAKKRTNCNVHLKWLTFAEFSAWSLANGYTDKMVLSRKGDVGDYSPDNASWVADEVNQAEANLTNAKEHNYLYKGEPVTIVNLVQYCKKHKLNVSHMYAIKNPDSPRKSHKGYTYKGES